METSLKKAGILLMLFFAFAYARAGYVGSVYSTPTCTGSGGSIIITQLLTDGTAPYTVYVYDSSTGYTYYDSLVTVNNDTISGLPLGSYLVEFFSDADYSGTVIDASVNVTSSLNLQSTVINTGCPADTGSISLSTTGGTAPYHYIWSNGDTGSYVGNLGGGTFMVTVSDASGCLASATETVQSVSTVSVTISNTGTACNPVLTATTTGGINPISYLWSTGTSGDSISGLSSYNYYEVTATDAHGCMAGNEFYLGMFGLQTDSNASIMEPGCSSTGSIAVHMTNGTAPYTFTWSPTEPNDSSITGLSAGTYFVTVTDANGCSGTFNYYLYQNTVSAYIYANTNPTCGSANGSATVNAYNGSGYYLYHWSNGATTPYLTNVPAGNYSVTVTDSIGGCTATSSFDLISTANYQVSVTLTPTACDTSLYTGTATALIIGSGGTAPYNFSWYGGPNPYSQTFLGTTQTISNLSYGTFVTVSVTDANGCSPNITYGDSFAIALDPSCYDHIVGYVYVDSSGTCTYVPGDPGMGGALVSVTSQGGQSYYANTDSTGFYDIEVLPGIYTVYAYFYAYGPCVAPTCVSSYSDTFTTTGQISSGNNFAISTGSAAFDLGVHPGCTPGTPGGTKNYWVYYFNNGMTNASNAVVTFVHDPTLTLVSTNPAYSSYNSGTQTVTWNVGTVAANSNWSQITMQFDVPATDSLGSILYAQAEIDPITGDCNPANNIVNISNILSASHDPNEKEVSPIGNLSAADTVLTYTIRFQNTGNAPANTVVIIDTLSSNVNPATVIPGASSAPYKYTMSGKGIMTFTFQGINLPDSSHGDSSIGFVSYTVHTQPDLPLGAQVANTASIYFDLNPAVVTNTTVNERSNNPNGIKPVNGGNMRAQVVPNPAQDRALIEFSGATGNVELRITDELGNTILSSDVTGEVYTLDAHGLSSGIYFYTAKDANGNRASGKISIVH